MQGSCKFCRKLALFSDSSVENYLYSKYYFTTSKVGDTATNNCKKQSG